MKTSPRIQKALMLFAFLGATQAALAQSADGTRYLDDFRGFVSLTTNGISTIPNLTLGKPAAMFTMIAERNGLSFEPELRFSLEGRPWAFLFWWRYDLVRNGRFRLDVGAHPAISFKSFSYLENGVMREVVEARRFLAGELSPNYQLAQNVRVGGRYLYSRGFEASAPENIHYLSFNAGFSGIGFSKGFFFSFSPQVYYLNIDASDGFYFTLITRLSHSTMPLSLSSIINIPFHTSISGGSDLLWNLSVIYSFGETN